MGEIFNMIISNDLLFYGIIVFLIIGVIVLFIYLHHRRVINLLEERIEFTKVEDEKINESLQNLAQASEINNDEYEINEKISKIDGKLAIEKIMCEEEIDENLKVAVVDNEQKEEQNTVELEEKEISIQEQPKTDLEIMLEKMQHDLDTQKEKDAVAIFEKEQEEKSIISYKELLEKKKELENMADLYDDERFENEPSMIGDLEALSDSYINLIENKETLSDNYIKKVENINDNISVEQNEEVINNAFKSKKFVTTDFISPVFGRRKAVFDYPKVPNFKDMMIKKEKTNEYDLEATLNLEPYTDQIKKDDAFLNALKDFRKNLE